MILCSCQQAPQTVPANPTLATNAENEVAGSAPAKDDEDGLFVANKEKIRREIKSIKAHSKEEKKLLSELQKNEHDPDAGALAALKLSRFYKYNRQQKSAQKALENAFRLSEKAHDQAIQLEIDAELGDAYLRLDRPKAALEIYEKAMKLAGKASEHGNNKATILERMAWAHRALKEDKAARQKAEEALAFAETQFGKRSPIYLVALTELTVFAMDRHDMATQIKLKKQLSQAANEHIESTFARHFLKQCANSCRQEEEAEQEEFLDAQRSRYRKN